MGYRSFWYFLFDFELVDLLGKKEFPWYTGGGSKYLKSKILQIGAS